MGALGDLQCQMHGGGKIRTSIPCFLGAQGQKQHKIWLRQRLPHLEGQCGWENP